MASSSGPRWDALGSGPGFRSTFTAWDLRWWILLAVATSVAAHGLLFLWLKRVRLPGESEAAASRLEERTGVFRAEMDRITVPRELLNDPVPETPDFTQRVERSAVTGPPDPTELAEALKNRDLVALPQLDAEAVNVRLSTPAAGAAGDLLETSAELRAAPELDLKNSLLSQSSSLAPIAAEDDRLTIKVDDPVAGGAELEKDMLETVKSGAGGNGGLDGFMSLDDLVNFNGPVEQDFKTMLRTDLLFDFASAELRSDARLSLMKLAAIIQNNPDAEFRLIGHTDTIGSEEFNLRLSERRAQAVKDWLVNTLRIDGGNIFVEGRGESEPVPGVNVNGTPEEQAVNRRVEIHKTGGRGEKKS